MMAIAPSALKGAKIIEFCTTISGAYCGKLMADLNAEVIKIEPPVIGDEARRKLPFPNVEPDPEKSRLFMYINTSKLGVTLDPSKPQGREIFKRLVRQADVLIEDHPPDVMEDGGLDYVQLKGINPGLIMMSITPFGRKGPYKDYKAYQLNISHMNGHGLPTFFINISDCFS